MSSPPPDKLKSLAQRLDEVQRKQAAGLQKPPPTTAGIAFRFSTEMVAGLVVGGGLGWGIDWLFGHLGFPTRPVFLIVMFVLGAAAGIRNVMRAASELNAQMAAAPKAPPAQKDDEEI